MEGVNVVTTDGILMGALHFLYHWSKPLSAALIWSMLSSSFMVISVRICQIDTFILSLTDNALIGLVVFFFQPGKHEIFLNHREEDVSRVSGFNVKMIN